jgi:hypothetical protein
MAPLQVWLVQLLGHDTPVSAFMRTAWGWPAMESVHFIGLCIVVGTIVVFDLRLLGLAPRIPIAALHRLIPWGLAGFAVSATSGSMFLLTEPDQYIYNPSFHFKIAFMAVAGVNALMFYVLAFRRTAGPGAGDRAPRSARIIAAISLAMWLGVIVAGRLLTFYRPGECGAGGPGVLADCIPD